MQAAAMPPQVAILQKKVQVLQSKLENQARLHEFDIDDRMQEQAEAAREHTTRIAESEMAKYNCSIGIGVQTSSSALSAAAGRECSRRPRRRTSEPAVAHAAGDRPGRPARG